MSDNAISTQLVVDQVTTKGTNGAAILPDQLSPRRKTRLLCKTGKLVGSELRLDVGPNNFFHLLQSSEWMLVSCPACVVVDTPEIPKDREQPRKPIRTHRSRESGVPVDENPGRAAQNAPTAGQQLRQSSSPGCVLMYLLAPRYLPARPLRCLQRCNSPLESR